MKRVLSAFLAAFLAFVPAQAGTLLLLGAGTGAPTVGGGFTPSCTESGTFLARTTGLDATHTTAYDTLICGLVTDAIWASIDAVWITATQDSTTAALNLKSTSFTLTPVNGPTFTADVGYQGNGTTQRLTTGFVPSTAGGNWTQNNASMWVWSGTAGQLSTASAGNTTNPRAAVNIRTVTDVLGGRLNDTTNDTAAHALDGRGLYGVQRTASNVKNIWGQGAQVGSNFSTASTGLPAQDLWLLGSNSTTFDTRIIRAAMYGAAIAGKESALNSRIGAWMTTFGVNP